MEQIREGFQGEESLGKEKRYAISIWGAGEGGMKKCAGEAEKSMMENQLMGLDSCVATDRINWCWTFHLTEKTLLLDLYTIFMKLNFNFSPRASVSSLVNRAS